MNKLKVLGTTAVIATSALGGAMPATADYMEWKFVGYNSKDKAFFYDTRHVARKGSVVAMPTNVSGRRDIFVVDCARGMYAVATEDGDGFSPEIPIPPDSIAEKLAGEVCY